MTITEQLAEKRAEFIELKAGLEAGDAEAIDRAEAIKSEIDELEKQEESAKRAKALLAQLGNDESKEVKKNMPEAKTIGEYAAANLDLTGILAGNSKSAGTPYGFKAYTDPHISVVETITDRSVVDTYAARNLAIRDLFASESISGNALRYFVMGATEDNSAAPDAVDEADAKPQFHVPYTDNTVYLQKIAGWFYETDELLEDNPYLVSAINARGLFELDEAIEDYLVYELTNTNGVGSETYTNGGDPTASDVFDAIMNVKTNSNFDADAIVLHPTDYATLRLAQDGASQMYGGGAFYGPYGNRDVQLQPGLWGLNTIVTTSIPQGTILVGAFKRGASVVTKAGEGQRVEIVTGDHDDAIYNRVTVVVEERLALAVRVPAAFCLLTEAGA